MAKTGITMLTGRCDRECEGRTCRDPWGKQTEERRRQETRAYWTKGRSVTPS